MQTMYAVIDGVQRRLTMPDADDYVLPGIVWGRFDHLFTPAYWRGQIWQHEQLGTYRRLRLGATLIEEAAACLLGGFGMKAELGIAAFRRLRDWGLLNDIPATSALEAALGLPFIVNGEQRRYRFPRQKAQYLAACLRTLADLTEHSDDVTFRDELTALPGVGLKTASWIVRNHRGSDAVAIIDVHVLRAGRHIGLFGRTENPNRSYRELEKKFLCFASTIEASAAQLDSLMWDYMRRIGGICGH